MSPIVKRLRTAITRSARRAEAPHTSRPRGHVVARAVGEPLPQTADGVPRGHVLGRRQPSRRQPRA